MGSVKIRPANVQDVIAIYGHPPRHSMKAYAAEIDGKTVGVAGLYYAPDSIIAFSNAHPDYRNHKIGAAKMTLKILDLLHRTNVPVMAVADKDIPTSEDFLLRCGFEYLMRTSEGEVYVWQKL